MAERIVWKYKNDAYIRCVVHSTQKQLQQNLHCLRLYYVLSGTLHIRIGLRNYEYTADEITIVNAHEPFSIMQEGAVVASFDLELSSIEAEIPELWFSRNPTVESEPDPLYVLKSLLARFVKFNVDIKEDTALLNRSMYYAIAHHLLTFFRVNKPKLQSSNNTKAELMDSIARYIDRNYTQPLSLNQLAEQFYLSPPYLSKMFKQLYGTTFSSYLMDIRLQNCLQALTSKEKSIEEISEQYGFPNSRSFISHFKNKYGITPGHYRKQHFEQLAQPTQGESDYTDIARGQELEPFAKYLESNVMPGQNTDEGLIKLEEIPPCNVNTSGTPLRHTFRRLISAGSAADILLAENQKMLQTIQREVGFQYIRFHGLLDDALMVYGEDENGQPLLNFSYVDTIFDFLLSIGLRPFIELSYMPKKLARSEARTAYYNRSVISLPSSSGKWCHLVTELVRHFNSRYGQKEVASWPFSLWNLPDSGSSLLGLGNVEEYFHFYEATYRAAKQQNADISFSAPSCLTETAEEGTYLREFLTLCEKNNCMPDLLQYHFYPIYIESMDNARQRLTYRYSPNALKESIETVYGNMQDWSGYPLPLYVSEWSSTISPRELLSDTAFQAVYIVKNVLENYDSTESLGYWTLADTISSGKMAAELFHGGVGLFTYNGIKKASYQAFRLLAKLGEEKLSSGEGYFITRSSNGWQILLYNYQHYSELYARGELFDMTFTSRYTPFPNAVREKFSLVLEGFEGSAYLLTETVLGQKYGSSFDKWLELGALPLKDREELEYLQASSLPLIKKRHATPKDAKLEISFTLEPHEVRLIEITPL